MRLFVSVIASAAMLFAASTASAAISYTATTSVNGIPQLSNDVTVNPGDSIEIAVQLLSDGEPVFGLGASATGYDPAVTSFVSGQSSAELLVQVCFPSFGCLGALGNSATVLSESNANPLGPEVQFVNAVATQGNVNTGAADLGPDGNPGPQTRLVFAAAGPGTSSIVLDALAAYGDDSIGDGGASLATTGDVVNVTVVPEPGTALLMGLGLAGLAAAGRRD